MQTAAVFNPTIHPVGEAVQAGPWQITLQRVELGDEALATMSAANPANGDGPLDLQWAIAWLSVTNTSDRARVINVSDFSACGAEGVLYQSPLTDGPDPLLQGAIEPGATLEGSVPFWIGDQSSALLRFSSPFLGGNWADAWFALTDGATMPAFEPISNASDLGVDPSSPAAFGDTVRSGDFDVTIDQYITGQEVFDIAPSGTRALGAEDVGNWHGFLITIRNVSSTPKFFSFVGLRLTDENGEPWDHLLALSAPQPDVARELLPGATFQGWALIETQAWSSLHLIRVQNNAISGNARYITFGATASAPTPEPVTDLQEGDVVSITMTPLNLRAEPSTSADIVTELDGTSTLTITGPAVEADGFTWYPVSVNSSDETGFVASNFLQLATVD